MSSRLKIEGLRFEAGEYGELFETALKKAQEDHLVERIWKHDYTLWKPQPAEISNRLGWLDVATRMQAEIGNLHDFAEQIRSDGIKKLLLLGMGGSSLGPELFSQMLLGKHGLALSVLDSTDPDAVGEKAQAHDPRHTLYIISSKSGGTVETLSFFKYFYNLALEKLGQDEAARHFIAITDPGSRLAKIGGQFSFRRVFLADPNIGGRYSALSYFGLVPAAFVGVDLGRLLSSAEEIAAQCKETDILQNPGAMLGLFLGTLASQGRDKATFILPEDKAAFGGWVEQLIAESLGKEGKGILPVVGEPELEHGNYGQDRLFISLNDEINPSIKIDWIGEYDVGAQFFLWEFAVAVAGYVLGINPFDQPNVEAAKLQARELVTEYQKSGSLPKGKTDKVNWKSMDILLQGAKPGAYIALQAYTKPDPEITAAFQKLRSALGTRTKLATTFGYGPRFLHSTGQLHKGDAGKGLFVQFISASPMVDVDIPDEAGKPESRLTFAVLKMAQAIGDAQALRKAGRQVLRFEIQDDPVGAVNALAAEVADERA